MRRRRSHRTEHATPVIPEGTEQLRASISIKTIAAVVVQIARGRPVGVLECPLTQPRQAGGTARSSCGELWQVPGNQLLQEKPRRGVGLMEPERSANVAASAECQRDAGHPSKASRERSPISSGSVVYRASDYTLSLFRSLDRSVRIRFGVDGKSFPMRIDQGTTRERSQPSDRPQNRSLFMESEVRQQSVLSGANGRSSLRRAVSELRRTVAAPSPWWPSPSRSSCLLPRSRLPSEAWLDAFGAHGPSAAEWPSVCEDEQVRVPLKGQVDLHASAQSRGRVARQPKGGRPRSGLPKTWRGWARDQPTEVRAGACCPVSLCNPTRFTRRAASASLPALLRTAVRQNWVVTTRSSKPPRHPPGCARASTRPAVYSPSIPPSPRPSITSSAILILAVELHARAGRDQAAHDDVLLQAAQVVHLAADRGLGEHARRLLEGRRRDERVGRRATPW